MLKFSTIVPFLALCSVAVAQVVPVSEGVLSSTRLLSVERVKVTASEEGPDGLLFCFLVSRTPVGQHKFAIQETRDFSVLGRSYRELSQSTLGRVGEPKMAVHDAAKYLRENPERAATAENAQERSLIVTLALSGPQLRDGDDVKVVLRLGFGRSAERPEVESLVFETKVPPR